MIHCKETQYGFEYGAAKVERLYGDKKKCWVCIGINTPIREMMIYVTETGSVRVYVNAVEWKPEVVE